MNELDPFLDVCAKYELNYKQSKTLLTELVRIASDVVERSPVPLTELEDHQTRKFIIDLGHPSISEIAVQILAEDGISEGQENKKKSGASTISSDLGTAIVVLAFKNDTDAFKMRDELVQLQKQEVISFSDAAVVVRDQDGKAKVKQATSLVGAGALGGAFWGMLIGMLFFAPWLGLAIGAVTGAIAGKFTDTGIDDKFIKEVGETIEPGHSALFLLVNKVTADKVQPTLEKYEVTVIQTSLSDEQEVKLAALFTDEYEEGAAEESSEEAEA